MPSHDGSRTEVLLSPGHWARKGGRSGEERAKETDEGVCRPHEWGDSADTG